MTDLNLTDQLMEFSTQTAPNTLTYYIIRFGDEAAYVDTTTTPHSLHYPKLQALADLTFNYPYNSNNRWIHAPCYPVNIPYPDMSYPSDDFPCIVFNFPTMANQNKVWAWRDDFMQEPVWFHGGIIQVETGTPLQLAIQTWWDTHADSSMSIATSANMSNYTSFFNERADWENINGNGRSLFGFMNPII